MITAIRFIMAVGLGLWLAGCGGARYSGTWAGMRSLEGPEHIVKTAGAIEITLESNGRYHMLIHSLPVDGTYTVTDGKITLNPKVVGGRDIIPTEGDSLMGEGSHLVPDGEDLLFHDVRGPDPTPIRLTPKRAANRGRNP